MAKANDICSVCKNAGAHRDASRIYKNPICIGCWDKHRAAQEAAQTKRNEELAAQGIATHGTSYDHNTHENRWWYSCGRCDEALGFDDGNLKPHTFEQCFNHVLERIGVLEAALRHHNLL